MDKRLQTVTTLHIAGGFACNDDCVFCTDKGPGIPKAIARPDKDTAREILRQNVGIGIVDFSTLEVTLNRDLPELVGYASELGYHTISISTNGRAIGRKDGELLRELRGRGLNRIHISIHGHTAEVHNRITQRQGSFEESIAGLEACVRERQRDPSFQIFMHSTICRLNYEYLPQMVEFYLRYPVEHYGLNSLQYQGAVFKDPELVAIEYPKVVAKLKECMPPKQRLPVSISEIPLCVVGRELPIHYYGIREDYRIAERDAESGMRSTEVGAPPREMVHGPPCYACVYRQHCDGVWERYAAQFGWEHFRPLTEADLDALHFLSEAEVRRLLSGPGGMWSVAEVRLTYDEAIAVLTSPKLSAPFELSLSRRDEAERAYRRTERYNVGLRGSGHSPETLALAELVVRSLQQREG